jgi:hypothetical protein
MKNAVIRYWRMIMEPLERAGRVLQSIAIGVGLFFLYIIGVGLTRLMMSVFFRRHLRLYKNDPHQDSYWKTAENYGADEVRLLKQI